MKHAARNALEERGAALHNLHACFNHDEWRVATFGPQLHGRLVHAITLDSKISHQRVTSTAAHQARLAQQ